MLLCTVSLDRGRAQFIEGGVLDAAPCMHLEDGFSFVPLALVAPGCSGLLRALLRARLRPVRRCPVAESYSRLRQGRRMLLFAAWSGMELNWNIYTPWVDHKQ